MKYEFFCLFCFCFFSHNFFILINVLCVLTRLLLKLECSCCCEL